MGFNPTVKNVAGSAGEKFADGRHCRDAVAYDLDRNQDWHRQQRPGYTPKPHPEDQENKNDHGIEVESVPEQHRRNEVRFQKVEQQIPGGWQESLPQRVESEQTDGGQQDDQRISGFKVIPPTQARTTGKTTDGRREDAIAPSRVMRICPASVWVLPGCPLERKPVRRRTRPRAARLQARSHGWPRLAGSRYFIHQRITRC